MWTIIVVTLWHCTHACVRFTDKPVFVDVQVNNYKDKHNVQYWSVREAMSLDGRYVL